MSPESRPEPPPIKRARARRAAIARWRRKKGWFAPSPQDWEEEKREERESKRSAECDSAPPEAESRFRSDISALPSRFHTSKNMPISSAFIVIC